MTSRFNQINKSFDAGDPINDEDLNFFIKKLEALEALLGDIDYPQYGLMHNDVRRRLDNCRYYRNVRKRAF